MIEGEGGIHLRGTTHQKRVGRGEGGRMGFLGERGGGVREAMRLIGNQYKTVARTRETGLSVSFCCCLSYVVDTLTRSGRRRFSLERRGFINMGLALPWLVIRRRRHGWVKYMRPGGL